MSTWIHHCGERDVKRPDRFFFEPLEQFSEGDRLELDSREAAHAQRVKRHGVGSEVELFDGHGRVARALIDAVSRRGELSLRIVELGRSPRPERRVWIATAVPKGDRMETMLDMLTQLGVFRLTPVVFARSAAQSGPGRQKRWRRVLVESCKQSRRGILPRLDEPRSLSEWLGEIGVAASGTRWLADPDGMSYERARADAEPGRRTEVLVVVGPEGGVTSAEKRDLIEFGFTPVALGDHVLRVETAAVAFAAALASVSEL
ncbi:MAG: 16S rRNA (uracil(1498)-N(3))-methyltransferase [Proteobacteria bacterium]|nr:MAG: 16S rRNA (uracil(1498)-N(3))-methyltransferase [Pseudomonadota bacterium]